MKKILILIVSILILNACSDDKTTVQPSIDTEFRLEDYNVVALYGFNQSLIDKSSNEIELLGDNVTYTNDRNNNNNSSLLLNNENDYPKTNVLYNSVLNLSPTFTISLWVKPDLNACKGDKLTYIDLLGRWFATGEGNGAYSLCLLKNGRIEGRTYNHSEPFGNTWVQSNGTLDDSVWSNIIITRDTTDFMTVYLNGELVTKNKTNAPQESKYELYIGKRRDNSSIFVGSMDDVIILDDFIDENKIKSLMNYNIK